MRIYNMRTDMRVALLRSIASPSTLFNRVVRIVYRCIVLFEELYNYSSAVYYGIINS